MSYFFVRFPWNIYDGIGKIEYKTTPVTPSLKKCKKDAYNLLVSGMSEGKPIQIWTTSDPYSTDLKYAKMFRIIHKVDPSPRKNLIAITILNAVGQPDFYLHKDGSEGGLVDYTKIRNKKKKKVPAPFGL